MADIAPYLEGAFLASMMQDGQQTARFLRDQRYRETNPILGEHPSAEKLAALGFATAGAQYGIYRSVPESWQTPVALASLLISADAVNHNRRMGFPLDGKALGLGGLVTALEVWRHQNAKKQKEANAGEAVMQELMKPKEEPSSWDIHPFLKNDGGGAVFNYRW